MVNSRKSSPRPYIRSNSRRKSGMSTYHRRCSRRQREPCGYIRHKRRSSDSDIGSSPPGTPYCRDPCYKRWRNCCRLPPSHPFLYKQVPFRKYHSPPLRPAGTPSKICSASAILPFISRLRTSLYSVLLP